MTMAAVTTAPSSHQSGVVARYVHLGQRKPIDASGRFSMRRTNATIAMATTQSQPMPISSRTPRDSAAPTS